MKGPVNCDQSEFSIYSRALAAGYWPISCSDTSRSAPLKSMTIASASYQLGKKTVCFPGFQFSMTCENSTANHGADLSIASPVDSPAPIFLVPEKEPELREKNPACG